MDKTAFPFSFDGDPCDISCYNKLMSQYGYLDFVNTCIEYTIDIDDLKLRVLKLKLE